jgi:HemY protein
MRFGLWALTGLLLGAVAAHFLLPDNGYVLVNFRGYVIEMSVPALVIVLVGGYWAVRVLVGVWRLPAHLGERLAERRQRGALRRLTNALVGMVEGDWRKGERLLTSGLKSSESPLVNYLLAARAAQQQGAASRRDEWLQIAHQEMPEAEVAVLLTQAELQFEAGELERALATLRRLEEIHPGHPMSLALLARTYRALEDWTGLVGLLPKLGAARLSSGDVTALAAEAIERHLADKAPTPEELAALWASVPSELRIEPELVRVHALARERAGEGEAAEQELRAAIRRHWDPGLIDAYGHVSSADPARQLRRAEAWLEQHPEDSVLLLTAARLCIRNELWGKARSYLESSLALTPQPDAYALYGRLLTRLGEQDGAARAYRSGLSLVASGDDLPALNPPSRRGRGAEDPAGPR